MRLEWFSPKEEFVLFVHNLLVHPAMGVLYLLGLKRLGEALHDASLLADHDRAE